MRFQKGCCATGLLDSEPPCGQVCQAERRPFSPAAVLLSSSPWDPRRPWPTVPLKGGGHWGTARGHSVSADKRRAASAISVRAAGPHLDCGLAPHVSGSARDAVWARTSGGRPTALSDIAAQQEMSDNGPVSSTLLVDSSPGIALGLFSARSMRAPRRGDPMRQLGTGDHQGRKRARHAQPLTARTPWYGQGDRQDRPSTVTASHGGTHARRSRMLKRTTCERPRLARDAGRRPRERCTST